MARILYSVQGVGLGHAMRSQTIINHLRSRGHRVLITANNKAFNFLKDIFPDVYKIKGVNFALGEDGRLKIFETLVKYFETLPSYSYYNFKELVKIVEAFKPQIVVTDFEPFAQVTANIFRLPLISIDNQHRLTHCQLIIPAKYYTQYLEAKTVVETFILRADYYLITSYAENRIKKDKNKTFLVPPVVRETVLKAKPTNSDHILVYMWSKPAEKLLPVFRQVKEQKFIIYGLNRSEVLGNITLRPFSDRQMVKDLASAKAVIANAGFTLITEALSLHKPLLVLPHGGQFEQILNGLELVRQGYGLSADSINVKMINKFLKLLPVFRQRLKAVNFTGNQKLFKILDRIIKKEI
jgi:uncharacterized protein (TIGR00661 family)